MTTTWKLLVVGCKPDSLGDAVATMASSQWDVMRAGVSGEEHELNVADPMSVSTFFRNAPRIDAIVCTAGINRSTGMLGTEPEQWLGDMHDQLSVNCVGPMRVLNAWLSSQPMTRCGHFVAISSNSAHIARSRSAGYCASKAALSMSVRCTARELAQRGSTCFPYVYEPGFIEGTPMSAPWEGGSDKPHRIPSGHALDVWQVARVILDNLERDGAMLSGTCIRLDGGEQ